MCFCPPLTFGPRTTPRSLIHREFGIPPGAMSFSVLTSFNPVEPECGRSELSEYNITATIVLYVCSRRASSVDRQRLTFLTYKIEMILFSFFSLSRVVKLGKKVLDYLNSIVVLTGYCSYSKRPKNLQS